MQNHPGTGRDIYSNGMQQSTYPLCTHTPFLHSRMVCAYCTPHELPIAPLLAFRFLCILGEGRTVLPEQRLFFRTKKVGWQFQSRRRGRVPVSSTDGLVCPVLQDGE